MEDLPIAKTLSIRGCGLDEYWLQDQIFNIPSCLGLGELDAIDKERILVIDSMKLPAVKGVQG